MYTAIGEAMVDSPEQAGRPGTTGPRPATLLFGILLIGLGGTAAVAAQTAFSLAQSASIWVLICAALTLFFLILRAQGRQQR